MCVAKSKVRLIVCGVECDLISDENESYVRFVGAEVDEAVRKITKETSGLSKSMINILALMNFCDKARKANEALGQLKKEMERLKKQNR